MRFSFNFNTWRNTARLCPERSLNEVGKQLVCDAPVQMVHATWSIAERPHCCHRIRRVVLCRLDRCSLPHVDSEAPPNDFSSCAMYLLHIMRAFPKH